MRRLLPCLVLALAAPAAAAEPSFPEDIAKLVELRKQKADVEKAEAALAAKLRAMHADLTKQLTDLGVIGPLPPAPPPKPADPLKAKLADAFKADRGTRDEVLHLAELYRLSVKLARDPAVPSTAELLRRVREAGDGLLADFGPNTLRGVRDVARVELLAALGKSDETPITDEERAAAADLFGRLAVILDGLGG